MSWNDSPSDVEHLRYAVQSELKGSFMIADFRVDEYGHPRQRTVEVS